MNYDSRHIHNKTVEIFKEKLGADVEQALSFFSDDSGLQDAISDAFRGEVEGHGELGFHLSDIRVDAAFLVALCLFPDRFTTEEVQTGIYEFMEHVPYHIYKAVGLLDA